MPKVRVMTTSLLTPRSRVRAIVGTVSTVAFLGGIVLAGTVVALAAVAVVGSVAGGLFAWSKSLHRTRERHSLYL